MVGGGRCGDRVAIPAAQHTGSTAGGTGLVYSNYGVSLEAGSYFQRGMSLGVRFGSIIYGMVINMNEQKLNTVAQLRAFLEGTEAVRFDVLGEDILRFWGISRRIRPRGFSA